MAWLAKSRVSDKLPGVRLPEAIEVSAAMSDLNRCDALLLATPAQAMRSAVAALEPPARAKPLVICAKGIERGAGLFLSDVVRAVAPDAPRACLSGPSFASDVAAGLPTAVTLAAEDEAIAAALSDALHGPTFRLYASTDLRGAEIGGAAQECAGDRLRRGGRTKPRRQREGGADRARLRGIAAFRVGLRGAAGNVDGALGSGRPAVDVLFGAIAQLFVRGGAGTGSERCAGGRRPPRRGRGDSHHAASPGACERRDHADRRCGVRGAERRERAVRRGGSAAARPRRAEG